MDSITDENERARVKQMFEPPLAVDLSGDEDPFAGTEFEGMAPPWAGGGR